MANAPDGIEYEASYRVSQKEKKQTLFVFFLEGVIARMNKKGHGERLSRRAHTVPSRAREEA